jgi:hypothetical protein
VFRASLSVFECEYRWVNMVVGGKVSTALAENGNKIDVTITEVMLFNLSFSSTSGSFSSQEDSL